MFGETLIARGRRELKAIRQNLLHN